MNRTIALERVAEKNEEDRAKNEEKRVAEEETERREKEEAREEAIRRMETEIAEVKDILTTLTLALQKNEKQTSSDSTN